MTVGAECVFCSIVRGEVTPGVLAYRGATTAVFPARSQRPQNLGHMLVVPVAHVPNIYHLDAELGRDLMVTVSAVARAVKKLWRAGGVAIKQHNDGPGGQDVFHVHFHVIPCHEGDVFFHGDMRFPRGKQDLPLHERVQQANRLRDELERDAGFCLGTATRSGTVPHGQPGRVMTGCSIDAASAADPLGPEADQENKKASPCLILQQR